MAQPTDCGLDIRQLALLLQEVRKGNAPSIVNFKYFVTENFLLLLILKFSFKNKDKSFYSATPREFLLWQSLLKLVRENCSFCIKFLGHRPF